MKNNTMLNKQTKAESSNDEPNDKYAPHDLEDAREAYFRHGGIESDIGPRDNPSWYWRRTVKLLECECQRRNYRPTIRQMDPTEPERGVAGDCCGAGNECGRDGQS